VPKVILTGYDIKIKKVREDGYKTLEQFDGKNDFFQVLSKYLSDHQPKQLGIPNAYIVKQADLKTIGFAGFSPDTNTRTIFGTVKIGEYGLSYGMVNVNNQSLTHNRTVDETDLFPIHFLFRVPRINDQLKFSGIAVFEKFRNRGAKGLFESHFYEYFRKLFPDYLILMRPLVPEEVLDSLTRGTISEVTLKSPRLPSNPEDFYYKGEKEGEHAKLTYTFSKKGAKKKLNDYLKNVISKKQSMKGVLVGEWFDVNEINAKVKVDGKDETIVIKEEKELIIPGLDITKNAPPEKNGFPPPDSVRREAGKYLKDLEGRLIKEL
jgi:hypothetical protein